MRRAISRMDNPFARPREISSRSDTCSDRRARWRIRGANPPSRLKTKRTLGEARRRLSPISLSVNPLFQPRHTAARSSGVNRLLDMQHPPCQHSIKGVASTGLHHPDPDLRRFAGALRQLADRGAHRVLDALEENELE